MDNESPTRYAHSDQYPTSDHFPSPVEPYPPAEAYPSHPHPYLVPNQFQPTDFAHLAGPQPSVYHPPSMHASPPHFEIPLQHMGDHYEYPPAMHPSTPTNAPNSSSSSRDGSGTNTSSPHTPGSPRMIHHGHHRQHSHGGHFVHRHPARTNSHSSSNEGSGSRDRPRRRTRSDDGSEIDGVPDSVAASIRQRKDEARQQRQNAEQRRRDELRVSYNRLQRVLPTTKDKMSKVRLVDFATTHISHLARNQQDLQGTIGQLEMEVARLRRMNESLVAQLNAASITPIASEVASVSLPGQSPLSVSSHQGGIYTPQSGSVIAEESGEDRSRPSSSQGGHSVPPMTPAPGSGMNTPAGEGPSTPWSF
ncbi:hypothetical protein BOTBODRAFT_34924 [Botryobasidium botryosum FD-172 SS1]|uniref:BHLH domain-containing protein n=1 Tax=Botryobasidium botryosum (strain FD-172 SS1) TaxID=930990 RepID=A0A067MBJ8_BOTB1|nr:hypothetical protein BOTBODRAFT_34924 [Botryobasidium botryosum FD-172 SS1]